MKARNWLLAGVMAATVALAGCAKQQQATVDTAPMEKSFSAAEPTTKSSADKVVSAVKSGDYAGAMTELKTLAGNAKLTPEQQQAVKDVMAQVQNAIMETANKAKEAAGKGMEDMKKALPK
jgi:hypothetical protein